MRCREHGFRTYSYVPFQALSSGRFQLAELPRLIKNEVDTLFDCGVPRARVSEVALWRGRPRQAAGFHL